ncbi:MAG: hypothetical protein F9K27_05980 [Anaerolineae bacterium]|nr:MAG: hypothetical protein F9K27_05980 [Anaerolineae bacterium]
MDTSLCGTCCPDPKTRVIKFAGFAALTAFVLMVVGFCNGITLISFSSEAAFVPKNHRERFGLGVIYQTVEDDRLLKHLGASWYLNWAAEPEIHTEVRFWPMLRVRQDGTYHPTGQVLKRAVEKSPGAVWIIGNEPDIAEQDGAPPLALAIAFHDAREEILRWDSTAQFAIGAVGMVSPLRLSYLDITLGIYRQRYGRDMPIDVWTIHQYILPEQKNAWGIGIPTGLEADYGEMYVAKNHNAIRYFQQGIEAFRGWMAARGFRGKPLIVTEFGLLLPSFTAAETAAYLEKTVSYLLSAQDNNLGYPADKNYLVQGFAWFALRDPLFETGTLVQLSTSRLTLAGQRWRELYNEADE